MFKRHKSVLEDLALIAPAIQSTPDRVIARVIVDRASRSVRRPKTADLADKVARAIARRNALTSLGLAAGDALAGMQSEPAGWSAPTPTATRALTDLYEEQYAAAEKLIELLGDGGKAD